MTRSKRLTSRRLTSAIGICATLAFGLLAFGPAALAQRANAADTSGQYKPTDIVTEIPIPLVGPVAGYANGKVADLANYIGVVYQFLISIIGLVAATMMIIGGFQYLTSAGDSSKIGAAKKRITDAMIGLVLALGAYALLNTINPALLQFKPLAADISSVGTQISFLPFCDDLAKSLKVDLSQITYAGSHGKDIRCGDGGYYAQKQQSATGTSESRLWCLFRGKPNSPDQDHADFGCEDHVQNDGKHALGVCLPYAGKAAPDPEKMFSDKHVVENLGICTTCVGFTAGGMAARGYTVGDQACQIWQNVANNGNPNDNSFKLSQKKIIQDTRTAEVSGGRTFSGKDRVYYCGYSVEYQACVYVGVDCSKDNISKCSDYEDETYASMSQEDDHAEIEEKSNLDLGSKYARTAGNAAHLIPVCSGDPCSVGGSTGCNVGGLAGVRNVGGVGQVIGGTVRMGVRIMSGGLLGSISCSAN